MNDLPVLRLSQLLTPEEMKIVQGVHKTHNVGFCPLGVCIPDKSCGLHRCSDSESGDFCEERYTPLSYYAVSVWRETVKRLEAMPEFADKCPCWDEFTECDWEWLKEFQEQLVDKYKGNFDE